MLDDGVSFYQLPGIAFALSARGDLAEDTRHPIDGQRFSGMARSRSNQRSEADVDVVLAQAEAAGGTVLRRLRAHRMGRLLRVFRRPRAGLYVWEIAVNPAWTVNEDGTLTI